MSRIDTGIFIHSGNGTPLMGSVPKATVLWNYLPADLPPQTFSWMDLGTGS